MCLCSSRPQITKSHWLKLSHEYSVAAFFLIFTPVLYLELPRIGGAAGYAVLAILW